MALPRRARQLGLVSWRAASGSAPVGSLNSYERHSVLLQPVADTVRQCLGILKQAKNVQGRERTVSEICMKLTAAIWDSFPISSEEMHNAPMSYKHNLRVITMLLGQIPQEAAGISRPRI